MKENLIYEGNTIYELDPECIREKEKRKRQNKAQGGKKEKNPAAGSQNNIRKLR